MQTVQVSYSESVHLFSTLDNVSGWWEGFVDPAYRESWEKRFGWTDEDEVWAARYAEYRHRTYVDPSQGMDVALSPHGLFSASYANARETDLLATYMVGKSSVSVAIEGLRDFAGPDAEMLMGFYKHFEPRWRELRHESTILVQHADKLELQLSGEKLDAYLERVGMFYDLEAVDNFNVFLVSFPSETRSSAEVVAGNSLLLHVPLTWSFEDGDWATIVAHEIVHHFSSRQSDASKRAMSDRFLLRCTVPQSQNRLAMLEEPLAVAVGQAAYSELVLGEPLDPLSNWYGNPWIDTVARTLVPSVLSALRSGSSLEETGIVEEAAERCAGLTFLIENADPPSDERKSEVK